MLYKYFKFILLFTIVNSMFLSCHQSEQKNLSGAWHATIETDGGQLPFQLLLEKNADSTNYKAYAINGAEKLALDITFIKDDSLHIPIEIFDAEIVAKVSENNLNGYWKRLIVANKYITSPFQASLGEKARFLQTSKNQPNQISGKYSTTFISVDGKSITEAVGIFEQKGAIVHGTFLTTTGDYRYLDGIMNGDSLKLSTFDGTHLFLFKAKNAENKLSGKFWSNIHGLENWTATLNPNAKLPDLDKLTYLKPGFHKIEFAFPEPNGNIINCNDKAFDNKVKIIQLMGTWCPNCMDETKYLAPWYDKNKTRGIEIIGLSFEKSTDMAVSGPKLDKMKARFGINYPVLLAGDKNNNGASLALPMLNKVMGFPTSIIIDKKGNVRQIHTGFSGPGTGQYYETWVTEFNLLIDKLVNEK
jgi:thiol-disulfide isomerase/thioredoxin